MAENAPEPADSASAPPRGRQWTAEERLGALRADFAGGWQVGRGDEIVRSHPDVRGAERIGGSAVACYHLGSGVCLARGPLASYVDALHLARLMAQVERIASGNTG